MDPFLSDIVDTQTKAYNLRDIDGYCRCFASDARILGDGGVVLAYGLDQIRERYNSRFRQNPNLHCTVSHRLAVDRFVIDHERVTGFEGGTFELLAVYEIRDCLIKQIILLPICQTTGPS